MVTFSLLLFKGEKSQGCHLLEGRKNDHLKETLDLEYSNSDHGWKTTCVDQERLDIKNE